MEILRERGVLPIILAITCIIAAGFPTAAQDVIKVQTELVNLNVVVRDHEGRRVSGLLKQDFEVFEDGVRQEVTHFRAEEVPLRLVLVFDLSLSMEAVLPTVKQGAYTLLGSLHPDDQVSVVAFATDLQQLSGWIKKEQAKDIIEKLQAEPHLQPTSNIFGPGYRIGDSNTFLWETFQHCFTHFEDSDDRVAIIMFTDGVDTGAGRDVRAMKQRVDDEGQEAMRLAQESWGLVYPIRYKTEQIIGYSSPAMPRIFPGIQIGHAPADPRKGVFEKITAAGGGEIFDWTTRADLLLAVGNVLEDLRSQYSLGYRPPQKDEAGLRHLKVRVKRPNLAVRTREGYIRRSQGRARRVKSP